MVDLIEGRLAWTRNHPSQIHIAEKESEVFGKIQDDHVDGGTGNGLLGFEHVKWVEAVCVEAECEANLVSSAAEKASVIDVLEVPEHRSIPNIPHDRCCGAVAGFS